MATSMAMRSKAAATGAKCSQRVQRSQAVVCSATSNGESVSIKLALASFAAAALLAAPAQAGVVLQQPELKKVFQSSEAPAAPKERAFRTPGSKAPEAAAAAPEKKKEASEPIGEFGVDPRALALPVAIGAIGGLGFLATKIDSGLTDWVQDSGAFVRDMNSYVGGEESIKGEGYLAPAGTKTSYKIGVATAKKGTTTKKTTAKSGTVSGTKFAGLDIKLPFQ